MVQAGIGDQDGEVRLLSGPAWRSLVGVSGGVGGGVIFKGVICTESIVLRLFFNFGLTLQ